jgi:hypothetical protein
MLIATCNPSIIRIPALLLHHALHVARPTPPDRPHTQPILPRRNHPGITFHLHLLAHLLHCPPLEPPRAAPAAPAASNLRGLDFCISPAQMESLRPTDRRHKHHTQRARNELGRCCRGEHQSPVPDTVSLNPRLRCQAPKPVEIPRNPSPTITYDPSKMCPLVLCQPLK